MTTPGSPQWELDCARQDYGIAYEQCSRAAREHREWRERLEEAWLALYEAAKACDQAQHTTTQKGSDLQ